MGFSLTNLRQPRSTEEASCQPEGQLEARTRERREMIGIMYFMMDIESFTEVFGSKLILLSLSSKNLFDVIIKKIILPIRS